MNSVLSEFKPPIDANRESYYSDVENATTWLSRLRGISNVIEAAIGLLGNHLSTPSRYMETSL